MYPGSVSWDAQEDRQARPETDRLRQGEARHPADAGHGDEERGQVCEVSGQNIIKIPKVAKVLGLGGEGDSATKTNDTSLMGFTFHQPGKKKRWRTPSARTRPSTRSSMMSCLHSTTPGCFSSSQTCRPCSPQRTSSAPRLPRWITATPIWWSNPDWTLWARFSTSPFYAGLQRARGDRGQAGQGGAARDATQNGAAQAQAPAESHDRSKQCFSTKK